MLLYLLIYNPSNKYLSVIQVDNGEFFVQIQQIVEKVPLPSLSDQER